MKYRLLTNEELSHLEKDLIAFLIVNGIDGPEWEKINKNTPEKALGLIEIFSDTVLEKVYSKLNFLEYRTEKHLLAFHVKEKETEILSLQLNGISSYNFLTTENIHEALIHSVDKIRIDKKTISHQNDRETEIHKLIEKGCIISSKDFWDSLMIS